MPRMARQAVRQKRGKVSARVKSRTWSLELAPSVRPSLATATAAGVRSLARSLQVVEFEEAPLAAFERKTPSTAAHLPAVVVFYELLTV